jgi:hypothetical protein
MERMPPRRPLELPHDRRTHQASLTGVGRPVFGLAGPALALRSLPVWGRSMGQYDLTLKHVIRTGAKAFLEAVGPSGKLIPLTTELPSAKDRRVDFLAVLERSDASRQLLHLELQSAPDPSMSYRMLGYYSDIASWLADEKKAGRHADISHRILQKIIYIGSRSWTPVIRISDDNVEYKCEVVYTRSLPARPLLQAGDLGDAVIAVLCADGTEPDMLKTILTRIVEAPADERAVAFAQLLILSELRGLRSLIEREWRAMAVTVNVENIPLLREPIDRAHAKGRAEGRAEGRTEGMAEAIQRLLERRFPGQVPDDLGRAPEGPWTAGDRPDR